MDNSGDHPSSHHAQLRLQCSPPPALLGCAQPPTQRSAEKGWSVVVAAQRLGLEVVEREPSAWELGRQQNEAGRGLGLPRPATTPSQAGEDA